MSAISLLTHENTFLKQSVSQLLDGIETIRDLLSIGKTTEAQELAEALLKPEGGEE